MSSIDDQIKEEIAANKILIYGKGTKAAPQCGFTVETIQFFNKYGYPENLYSMEVNPINFCCKKSIEYDMGIDKVEEKNFFA